MRPSFEVHLGWLCQADGAPCAASDLLLTLRRLSPCLVPNRVGVGERLDIACDTDEPFIGWWKRMGKPMRRGTRDPVFWMFRWGGRGTEGAIYVAKPLTNVSMKVRGAAAIRGGRWGESASSLGQLFSADVGIVHASERGSRFFFGRRDVLSGLIELYWGTYFGPVYVELIGKKRLNALSRATVRWVGDDAALVLLTDNVLDEIERPGLVEEIRRVTKRELGDDLFVDPTDPDRTCRTPAFAIPPKPSPEEVARRIEALRVKSRRKKAPKLEPVPGPGSSQPGPATHNRPPTRSARGVHDPAPEVLECASYFRRLGFFAAIASDSAVVERAIEEEGDVLSSADALGLPYFADLVVLRLDEARVWWEDLEADVGDGNRVYANEVIPGWARVARTIAEVTDCTETWSDGGVTIAFKLNGKPIELHAEDLEDWIDLRVLSQFDAALGDRPAHLRVVHTDDQTAFVVALTDDELTQLQRDRGWRFLTEPS